MDKNQQTLEHDYLQKIQDMIESDIDISKSIMQIKENEYEHEKKAMFEDMIGTIRDSDDIANLYQKNEIVNEKSMQYHDAKKKLTTLTKQQDSPYFGRIDFKENNSSKSRTLYIGKFSYCDDKTMFYYICDWRAPISSLYYEHDTGYASYETPNGTKSGDISLKRLFDIENRTIKYMYDADSLAKDDILAKTLSENTNQNLKVIIHSIQEDQNKAIRYPAGKHMLITGPAGSGKTSVGLHRLAYILYHNRSSITSKQIAILSNNNIFCSYISTIIPELGEEGVVQVIYTDLLKRFIPKRFTIEDFYQQTESIYTEGRQSIKSVSSRIKSSYSFLKHTVNYVNTMQLKFKDITYGKKVIVKKEDFYKKFNHINYKTYSTLKTGLYYFIENEVRMYFSNNKSKIKKQIYKNSDEFLGDGELNSILQSRRDNCIKNAKVQFIKNNNLNALRLYPMILKQYLSTLSTKESVEYFNQISSVDLSDKLCNALRKNLDRGFLSYEDANAILCIKILLGEVKLHTNVKHVLIDEAQDYSATQLYNIKQIYSNSHQTLLADINQSITPDISANLKDMAATYGTIDVISLQKSYRSSGPINRLANSFMNIKDEIKYFNRDGSKPMFVKTTNNVNAIKDIIANKIPKDMLVGILTVSAQSAEGIFSGLSDNEDIQLIIDANKSLNKRITIMPVVFSKGLEFDAVIIADFTKAQYENMQYLMCTRALHLLYILGQNPNEVSTNQDLLNIVSIE